MEIFSLVTILIAIVAFMYVCMKGIPPQIAAIFVAVFVMITSGIPIVGGAIDLTDTTYGFNIMLASTSSFAGRYLLTFLSGAIFGCLMGDSGAARSIAVKLARLARRFKGHEKLAALWTLPVISFILSYGGISAFVCFFTVIAVAKELFKEMDIPWRLYGVHMVGAGVLALTMAPGSPSVNNVIAGNALGTTAMSGAVLGLIACVLMIVFSHLYFCWELSIVKKKDEHFLPTGAEISKVDWENPDAPQKEYGLVVSLLPSILLWAILNIFKQQVWVATFFAILLGAVLYRETLKGKMLNVVREGFNRAVGATITVAIIVGMGSVIAATPGYGMVISALNGLGGNGYLQVVIAVNVAAGITASSSGGLTIALGNLSDHFLQMGLNPAAIHRIACISSGGLDSLPCSGTVLNEIYTAKLTPAEAYRPFGVLSVLFPICIAIIVALLANLGIA